MISALYENDSFLIVNKPAGLSSHNGPENLLELTKQTLKLNELHLINRLDQETSGLVTMSKKSSVVPELTEALKKGEKKYLAILRGALKIASKTPEATVGSEFSWQQALTDKAEGRKNPQGISADRKPCETTGLIRFQNKFLTAVELTLHTGRQHQIRKHSAIAGHAIVGDPRYNDDKYNSMIEQRYGTSRMMLHAHHVEFSWKSETVNVTLPLPAEFLTLLPDWKF